MEYADPHRPKSQRAGLLAAFRQTAAAVTSAKLDHISEATLLSELVIDSLAMVEVLGELEERLDVGPIPDESLSGLSTVGDLLGVLEAQLARRAGTARADAG